MGGIVILLSEVPNMKAVISAVLTLASVVRGDVLYCASETDPDALCNAPNRPSYLVPDSLDCSIFYYCTDLGNEQYAAQKMECGEGLAFSDASWPVSVIGGKMFQDVTVWLPPAVLRAGCLVETAAIFSPGIKSPVRRRLQTFAGTLEEAWLK